MSSPQATPASTAAPAAVVKRPFYHKLCQAWFALLLLVLGSLCYLICTVIHLLPISRRKKASYSAMTAKITFRLWLRLTPWIRFDWSKQFDWDKAFSAKNSVILLNHTSFLDGFFATSLLPLKHISRVRTLLKASLLKIPVIGGILRMCGHFPIYFTSQNEGVFKVDIEKQKAVENDTKEHLGLGGSLVFFPEGQVSNNPEVLQLFRRGGFGYVKEYNTNVYGLVMKGCTDIWPKNEPIGGLPGTLKAELIQVFSSSEVASMSQEDLCSEAQARMQKVLDALYGR